MPNLLSHDREKALAEAQARSRARAKRFAGFEEGEAIIRCLNLDFPQENRRQAIAARRRVLEILDGVKGAAQKVRENQLSGRAVAGAFASVNRLLERYPIHRCFVSDRGRPTGWKGEQVFNSAGSIRKKTFDALAVAKIEAIAIHGVVWMADAGLLDRFRICECSQWYFARFSHQNFCSSTCRVRFWENSEQRKEHKRQRARENYLYKKAHPTSAKKER